MPLTAEEDIDVIASDLIIESSGRIDKGAIFPIGGGCCGMTGDSTRGNFSVVEA
jgi:hypothetical protein